MPKIVSFLRRRGLIPESLRAYVKFARVGRDRVLRKFGMYRYSFPALNSIDRILLERLPDRGTFLEIGANDGYNQSNTYYLEEVRGWAGILVEPVPRLFVVCSRIRKKSSCYNFVCAEEGAPETLLLDDSDLTSKVQFDDTGEELPRGVMARTSTLSRIIEDSPFTQIDFMSVDVEGAELSVLAGLDMDRHCPAFLLVETDNPEAVDKFLGSYMIRDEKLTFHDYLWVRAKR